MTIKLNEEQRTKLLAEYAAGANPQNLALRYGLSRGYVYVLVAGTPQETDPRKQGVPEGCPLLSLHLAMLSLASTGKEDRQIASELRLAKQTIRHYFSEIYTRLGIRSRAAVVVIALREHWIDFPSEAMLPIGVDITAPIREVYLRERSEP